jgi:V/A-type H+-transporting ATPase subunit I
MKLVTIAGPLHDFDAVVYSSIINQQFHPEPAANVMKNIKYLRPFDQQNPYAEMLRQAESVADRLGVALDYRPFESLHNTPDESAAYLRDIDERYQTLKTEEADLTQRIGENERILMQINHLLDVNVPLEEFFTMIYVKFRFGRMPRDIYNGFIPHMTARSDLFFFPTSIERDWAYGMYMTPRQGMDRVDALFASLQFERIRISDRVHGTGGEALLEIQADTEHTARRLEEVRARLDTLAKSETEPFLRRYSYIRFMNDSFNIRRFAAHTEESFYLLGWVPGPEYDAFAARLGRRDNLTVVVAADDPDTVADYTPPIRLKNARIFRPFEPLLAMYGLPAYHEMDPTPVMAITYTLLFGLMFGDAGQGALLILAGFLMYKLKGMWLGRVVMYGGASAMLFGTFVYGSVFGFEDWLPLPSFKILENSANTTLGLRLAVYLGVGMLVLSILANIVNGIRRRDPGKILVGPAGLAGLILYLSVTAGVLPILGFAEQILPFGAVVALAALPVLLIFLREPLSHMLARRGRWKPEKMSDFLAENLFELIEVLLSYITNTISFLRVGAYAISHASMMSVIFMLAGGAEHPSIPVVIIGNLIVMGIEGLLVGIQALRLEFYELFSRFYSGDGRPYNPIIIDYHARHERNS